MRHQRHDAGRIGGIVVDLLELVDRALGIFRTLVMLDRDHGDVVDFLRVGHVDDRLAARLQPDRLIVEHPIGDVIVAFFGQDIGRLPGFGEARSEPAARRHAGRLDNDVAGLADVGALVRHFLHVALGEAVPHELPFARDRGAHDGRIGGDRRAVDGERHRDRELIEQFGEAPEADPVAVFVPGPVGHVRASASRRRAASAPCAASAASRPIPRH